MSSGREGFVLWLTGLSGSGKSTLATLLAIELRKLGTHVETLDGDEVRKNLSHGLGFSRDDRDRNIRRLGYVAKLVSRSGACAITAAISPYHATRDEVRRSVARFCEVYCECPIDVLAERDPKGLYLRALRGEIKNFTGVDDPYEAPTAAEVHLRTDRESPEQSVARVMQRLHELGYVAAPTQAAQQRGPLPPHGGDVPDLFLPESGAELARRAAALTQLEITEEDEQVLGSLASGAFAPLRGFMNRKDAHRVARERRLESGLRWPFPLLLPIAKAAAEGVQVGETVALTRKSSPIALLTISDVWSSEDGASSFVGGDIAVPKDALYEALGPRRLRAAQPAASSQALMWLDDGSVRERQVAQSASEFSDRLILATSPALRRSCEWLDSPASPHVVAVSVWRPAKLSDQDSLLFQAIVARNFGARRCFVARPPEATDTDALFARSGAGEIGVDPSWFVK